MHRSTGATRPGIVARAEAAVPDRDQFLPDRLRRMRIVVTREVVDLDPLDRSPHLASQTGASAISAIQARTTAPARAGGTMAVRGERGLALDRTGQRRMSVNTRGRGVGRERGDLFRRRPGAVLGLRDHRPQPLGAHDRLDETPRRTSIRLTGDVRYRPACRGVDRALARHPAVVRLRHLHRQIVRAIQLPMVEPSTLNWRTPSPWSAQRSRSVPPAAWLRQSRNLLAQSKSPTQE